ncbi:MAG TPA: UrcA family protein [Steroidobacteraceae bacterium]|nr:UrcA family protein [Steroidobacteraceae bacterium]
MSIKPIRIFGCVVLSSALLTASLAVYADNPPVQRPARSASVQFGDLNLDSSSDVAALYQRINLAAEHVCSSRAFTGIYYTLSEYRGCVADAVQSAVASVNRASLTDYYRQRLSRPATIRVAER